MLSETNLFIYGSLRDSQIFKSVAGLDFTLNEEVVVEGTLFAEPAMLAQHKRVSPDNVYFYAVRDAASKIEGFVIYDVPGWAMAEIDKYEGKRYQRETVEVNTAQGKVACDAYLVSRESMAEYFGDRWHVNLIHELWLRKRIEQFIKRNTRPGEHTADAELERRAERELLGTTERDLVITHYRSDAVSDFYLERELDRPRPSIEHLRDSEEAKPYVANYLGLVIKQVLLNQLDARVLERYRFELEHIRTSERYYKRSISLFIALTMVNNYSGTTEPIIGRALEAMPIEKFDLVDYVKYAINASDSLFDERVARSLLERVRSNFQPGLMPLGAEIELSNQGFAAVAPAGAEVEAGDRVYDGFKFFNDFGMDIFSWKLGGYIDDHTGDAVLKRKRGFLEFAPGRLNVAGELSRPATADPWLLNQLIHAILKFYGVKPHSLHLSFQLRKNQIGRQTIMPIGFVKCLLVLGGGLESKGRRLWVSRMQHDEIKQRAQGEELVFARTSKRNWYLGESDIGDRKPKQAQAYVQQYKFIRLEERANYEALILCLKGLQISINPGDYLTAAQLKDGRLRYKYEELKRWSENPTQIRHETRKKFLEAVGDGLMREAHNRPCHKLHYIDWALSAVDVQLRMFNKRLEKGPLEKPEIVSGKQVIRKVYDDTGFADDGSLRK